MIKKTFPQLGPPFKLGVKHKLIFSYTILGYAKIIPKLGLTLSSKKIVKFHH